MPSCHVFKNIHGSLALRIPEVYLLRISEYVPMSGIAPMRYLFRAVTFWFASKWINFGALTMWIVIWVTCAVVSIFQRERQIVRDDAGSGKLKNRYSI